MVNYVYVCEATIGCSYKQLSREDRIIATTIASSSSYSSYTVRIRRRYLFCPYAYNKIIGPYTRMNGTSCSSYTRGLIAYAILFHSRMGVPYENTCMHDRVYIARVSNENKAMLLFCCFCWFSHRMTFDVKQPTAN